MRHLHLALVLACVAPAQAVTVANRSQFPFEGCVRVVCDPVPETRVGVVAAPDGQLVPFFVGQPTGANARAIDLRLRIPAGKEITLNLKAGKVLDKQRAARPKNDNDWFGGPPMLGGAPMAFVRIEPDGIGYACEWRARFGRMLLAKLWMHWNPSEPWAKAELLVVASAPTVPDMTEAIPDNFGLTFGDAQTLCLGCNEPERAIMPKTDVFADGQGRALPVTFVWHRLMAADSLTQQQSVAAMHSGAVSGIGVSSLYPKLGNPLIPSDFNAQAWADARRGRAIAVMHTFDSAVLGPNRNSRNTGEQEDQLFRGNEALVAGGVGAELIQYYSVLKMWARPSNHFEVNGQLVDVNTRPNLAYWDGRPYSATFALESLGKTRGLSVGEANAWWGPDDEHWCTSRLAATCRLMYSPACQELLRSQALIYLAQNRVEPDRFPWLSTPLSARSNCYEGLLVCFLLENLADRDLARRIEDRGRARLKVAILPRYTGQPGDVMDWRDDPRIGGRGWSVWQQSCGALGIDLMSERLGSSDGRKVAFKCALAVIRDAFSKEGGEWSCLDIAGNPEVLQRDAYFWFGTPCAIATVLRTDATHEQARSIWSQYMATASQVGNYVWLCPGIKP